jgi:hypothetical protein
MLVIWLGMPSRPFQSTPEFPGYLSRKNNESQGQLFLCQWIPIPISTTLNISLEEVQCLCTEISDRPFPTSQIPSIDRLASLRCRIPTRYPGPQLLVAPARTTHERMRSPVSSAHLVVSYSSSSVCSSSVVSSAGRHRRLCDPNMPNDLYPDPIGRDFDQDSVGRQRRRSFYFVENSLRGPVV